MIEFAIGGEHITTTLEGRKRYPVREKVEEKDGGNRNWKMGERQTARDNHQ